jgi:hypothetical protein
MSQQGSLGNVVAAVCCFFIPGLGQLVQGRIIVAALFFVVTSLMYASAIFTLGLSWVLALPLHLWCIINAARYRGDA